MVSGQLGRVAERNGLNKRLNVDAFIPWLICGLTRRQGHHLLFIDRPGVPEW